MLSLPKSVALVGVSAFAVLCAMSHTRLDPGAVLGNEPDRDEHKLVTAFETALSLGGEMAVLDNRIEATIKACENKRQLIADCRSKGMPAEELQKSLLHLESILAQTQESYEDSQARKQMLPGGFSRLADYAYVESKQLSGHLDVLRSEIKNLHSELDLLRNRLDAAETAGQEKAE